MSDTSSKFFSNHGITESTRYIHTPGEFALANLYMYRKQELLRV